MKIENWSVVSQNPNPYQAPETLALSMHGRVFGHPRFKDGTTVTTSGILGKNDKNEVVTVSGSSYELGQIDPFYEQKFPKARNRLLDSLKRR